MNPPQKRRLRVVTLLAMIFTGLIASVATAEPSSVDLRAEQSAQRVEILPLRGGFIDPPVVAQIQDVISRATEDTSALVVLQYSSRGGVSANLDALLDRIDDVDIPVATLVGPLGVGANAAGAAAVLWLAGDIRALSQDATIGPIDPVDFATDTLTAERLDQLLNQRISDPALIAALRNGPVDALTLADAGVATAVVAGLEPLLVELDGQSILMASGTAATLVLRPDAVDVRFHSLGLLRRVLHAATTAPFIYLLLIIGLGMLLFELFQPGFGVAGLAGIITAAIGVFGLVVLPVNAWAVALVILGLLLYALDTAIAGFGWVTFAATTSFVVGSLWFYTHEALALSAWLVAATTLTVFVFFVFVMTTVLRAQAGPEGVTLEDLVGRSGIVRSVLNPEGHVYIDGALWRARWTGGTKRVKVGTPVTVHGVDGALVLVEPFAADSDTDVSAASHDEA
ncbi:MAG: NfeD family protein [Nitriliruptoraceae bacterium]